MGPYRNILDTNSLVILEFDIFVAPKAIKVIINDNACFFC